MAKGGGGRSNGSTQGDDSLKTSFFVETTSKILVLASDGKVYTLEASKLPGGCSQGEPIRLMADIDENAAIVAVWPYATAEKMLLLASDGRGFVVAQDEMISSTRKGRAVIRTPALACFVTPATGDHVATIGENRKLLEFPLSQVPQMARGKGVRLPRFKDGGLSDARPSTRRGSHRLRRRAKGSRHPPLLTAALSLFNRLRYHNSDGEAGAASATAESPRFNRGPRPPYWPRFRPRRHSPAQTTSRRLSISSAKRPETAGALAERHRLINNP